jgi:hypothetical protein
MLPASWTNKDTPSHDQFAITTPIFIGIRILNIGADRVHNPTKKYDDLNFRLSLQIKFQTRMLTTHSFQGAQSPELKPFLSLRCRHALAVHFCNNKKHLYVHIH